MTWRALPRPDDFTHPLEASLRRLSTTMGLARPDTIAMVERHWPALVGAQLARHSWVESVRGGELVVRTDEPAVAEHLRWMARDLLDAVNAVGGGDVVDQLVVRVKPG